MIASLLEKLRCPVSAQALAIDPAGVTGRDVGWLQTVDGRFRYPIRDGIPRFVAESNYADNFGFQWNVFARTQLDSHSGLPISRNRFWNATGWDPSAMRGKWVLDVGCGSGRFAEIALSTGAHVVALDYSSAVDACRANLRQHPNLHIIQGDVYALPFAPGCFDFVYSLGVLQHTPDVQRAFSALPIMLSSGGGRLCVDYYEKSFKSRLLPKYWLRPVTRRMDKRQLFSAVQRTVPVLLPVSRALARVPVIGALLKRLVPVANYEGLLPLSGSQLEEWAVLDTFDWLSPTFDNPQTAKTVRRWFEQTGMVDIEVLKAGHLVGRARRP
ncbi:MAG: class I SAM-dependent methyltransferase [Gammaproteobacteria bacterium]|nr:class I SAM-dependent methyltransferase [Gammaproteobacteria bacterium]